MTREPLSDQSGTEGPLSFYDHHRQRYGHLPIRAEAEFMIGDYGKPGEDEGVGKGGEFRIALVKLGGSRTGANLHPHLEVFGDAVGSLAAAIQLGLLKNMEPVSTRDEFSQRLVSLGIYDRSAYPVGSAPPVCPSCGKPREEC